MLHKILTWPWRPDRLRQYGQSLQRAVSALSGRAARWLLLKRPIHFTRFGTFYILFSLAVGAAAINTGNNLLYLMLGLLLGFIIISGFLSDSCLWGLEVAFEAIGDFYVGQPAEWDLVVHKNWFPAVIMQVEAFWQQLTTRHLFYWVPRYGTQRLRVTVTPEQRGLFRLQSVRYATRFPFGLFEKSHQEQRTESWVVFPRLKILPVSLLRAAGAFQSDQPSDRKGPGATPFDLREYQEGDSRKRIHWKSSAKRGFLMVSEMEEESAISQQVIVSQWPAEAKDREAFISFVASLVYSLNRQGQRVGLRTPGFVVTADTSRDSLKKILTYLALVDPDSEQGRTFPTEALRRGVDAFALWRRASILQ